MYTLVYLREWVLNSKMGFFPNMKNNTGIVARLYILSKDLMIKMPQQRAASFSRAEKLIIIQKIFWRERFGI